MDSGVKSFVLKQKQLYFMFFRHDKIEWDVITAREAYVKQYNDEER